MKSSFLNDYSEGAHENIIRTLTETNRVQTVGYGKDEYCLRAKRHIQAALGCGHSRVHFLVGGTQVNLTVISSVLRPYQGVISAETGHVNVHESGAIEATGHKVLALPAKEGKITAKQIDDLLKAHFEDSAAEHTVQPGMVYISQPTELGTIYSKAELSAIYDVCHKRDIPLFIDGARLGCALTSDDNDLEMGDLAELCDIFYIGGTKMGALFGEALVINNPVYDKDFRYMIKQRGGMLAKGRLLGLQFEALFTNDLYFDLARHANEAAKKLANGIAALGYKFAAKPVTNQIFPIFPKSIIKQLETEYLFEFNSHYDEENDVVRFCTSWATDMDKIDEFLKVLELITEK
ncbi:MAG: aminotransferase class I/II-fold pyridoxal phosphate-dependent enzyme [Oscillospiraceae bacterium]|nr:aminotransferase class I/II-fold pyridoxal phosphate-dependent enzyme [Oscillospiraceae bacterium]